ncbi:MAG: mechanosensitive ion channel family protein [Leptospirales bacterium]
MRRNTYLLIITIVAFAMTSNRAWADSCESPRDSMRTLIVNMNLHLQLVKAKKVEESEKALQKAMTCFDLEAFPFFWRSKAGKESAYLILETMHRSWVLDWKKIPGRQELLELTNLTQWYIPNTKIDMVLIQEGERKKQFLISTDALLNIHSYYTLVKDQPYLTDFAGTGYVEPAYHKYISGWAKVSVFGILSWQWIILLLILVVGYMTKPILRKIILSIEGRIYRLIVKEEIKEKTGLGAPLTNMALVGIYYISLYVLRLEGGTLKLFGFILQLFFSGLIVWFAFRLSGFVKYFADNHLGKNTDLDPHMFRMLVKISKAFVVVIGILVAIHNAGINVVSLMAGLGLGGLALALAAKDTAANFFGSLMIMMDRPFKVGDWVALPGAEGDVEDIGIRSTKIRTFYNSIISVPNSVMAYEKIDNMGLREYRRVKVYLGITYDSSPEKIEIFLEGLKKIIQANPTSKKDGFHVVFNDFGPSSLDILLYFFLKVPDWSAELIERQNIFLEILRLAKEVGVDFAYPSQSIYMEKPGKSDKKKNATEMKKWKKQAEEFGPEGKNSRPSGSGIYTPVYLED